MTKKITKVILGLILILIIAVLVVWFGFLRPNPPSISIKDRAQISLIPLPSELKLGNGKFIFETDFGYSFPQQNSQRLQNAVERFYSKLSLVSQVDFSKENDKKLLLVCKKTSMNNPNIEDDESYELIVKKEEIKIIANEESGILHGLETLFQLVKKEEKFWIPEIRIKDSPRFAWRGLMIDSGRHWVSKEVILRNIEAMAAVKMNVLHLHLTEFQAFRIESKLFPRLHEMGSKGNYYSQEDIKEIIDFAKNRNIRVIPEFDVPGHTTSWFIGYPELASTPDLYTLDTIFGVLDPVMDPSNEYVYEFLDQFFGEMAQLFPDEYVHIGGDEVNPKHWGQNELIKEFMKNNSLSDVHQLQAYFNLRIQKILEKHGKKMMGWDEILHADLPKDGIAVQSWRNHKSLWDAARAGNKTILSTGYYLDHKQSAEYIYKVDPLEIAEAITIDIDSTNWKAWKTTMTVMDSKIDGYLYLFGDGEKMNGIVASDMMTNDFSEAVVNGDALLFNVNSTFGKISYDLMTKEDSIFGKLKVAVFNIDLAGKRVGGSEMADGMKLPKFEKIEPLNSDSEKNILGGEACMWSEMVDDRSIDSRIWPRAAVVAEKLWSPSDLTKDTDDMYRRLMNLDTALDKYGLKHNKSGGEIIKNRIPEQIVAKVETLVEVLQEDLLFNRMQIYTPMLYTFTPLDRVVDAARPESYIAYKFNKDVDLWFETKDEVAAKSIVAFLHEWSNNYNDLKNAFEWSDFLKEVEPHSKHLSELSQIALVELSKKGLAIVKNTEPLNQNRTDIDTLLTAANLAYGGTLLPVVSGLRRLIKESDQ